jgi:hypothetical protein
MIFHTNFKTVLFLTLIITIGSMNYGILAGTQDESVLHKYSGVFNGSEAGGMPVENDMEMMIDLLEKTGIDTSYGEDGGSIFSMVDISLTRIIDSLSSGDIEGFMDIPLIKETLAYFHINVDDIVLSPNETPKTMEAIDNYAKRYE